MSGFPNQHRNKIALVGAGMIGGSMAYLCAQRGLGDVVLFDVVKDMPMGKGLDLTQAATILDTGISVEGANDYSRLAGADVVIITAGITKIPGKSDKEWSRADLLPVNCKILREVGLAIKQHCPNAFIINITNPLDVMVGVLQEASGVAPNKICGMAGQLDSGRFRRFIADKLGVASRDVQGMVIGVHSDNMLPLTRFATVNGIPLNEFVKTGQISKQDIQDLVARTKVAAAEIVTCLGQGSAYFAPACGAIDMAEAYLKDQKRVFVCSCYLTGQYGVTGSFLGVPCVLGGTGVERVIELELDVDEKKALQMCVEEVQGMSQIVKGLPQ